MRKNKVWIFKSYHEMIISILLFAIFIAGFIYIGTIDFSKDVVSDSEKFTSEHKEVAPDNVFSYINASDAYSYIKSNNVIMLFGIKDSDWVGYYANVLNEAAKEVGIDKIYYYDITEDREDDNATYESITNYLDMYLTFLDDGTLDIYCPTLIIKKDGRIIYYDDETALIRGKTAAGDYWTDSKQSQRKTELKSVLEDYLRSEDGKE